MTLTEFKTIPVAERPKYFERLSLRDQIDFISSADPVVLLLGGYPTEERILARLEESISHGGQDGKTMH